MRFSEILEHIQLDEAQGGMAKRYLETQKGQAINFVDAQKNRYTIANVTVFPDASTPNIPVSDLGQLLKDTAKKLKIDTKTIQFTNPIPQDPNKLGAGILVVMQDEHKQLHSFFRYESKRKPDAIGIHWSPTDFAQSTGIKWEETRMSGKGAEKTEQVIARVELKPRFSVPTNTRIPIAQIPEQSAGMLGKEVAFKKIKRDAFEANKVDLFKQLLTNALLGSNAMVPGLAPYERDIRVDFGEVASPLALASGKNVGGDYVKVQTDLLKEMGVTWKGITAVNYPEAQNEALFDSILVWGNGETLRVSNKAEGKGGAASLSSIIEVIDKYPERFSSAKDQALLNGKYAKFVNIIRDLVAVSPAWKGVVAAAKNLKFIDAKDEEIIIGYAENRITRGTKGLTPRLIKYLKDPKVMAAKTDAPDYGVCFHLLGAMARLVVGYLNQDVELSTEFFKFVLSRANLIQVNQFTHNDGQGGVGWSKFDVKWPPVFNTKIKFSASDYQSNKMPTSRLAFKT